MGELVEQPRSYAVDEVELIKTSLTHRVGELTTKDILKLADHLHAIIRARRDEVYNQRDLGLITH